MHFTVREFDPADFDTLWRIDQACFPAGISYSRAELKFYIRRSESFTLVAIEAGRPAPGVTRVEITPDSGPDKRIFPPNPLTNSAIAGFIVTDTNRGSGHIITIDVLADIRRRGVGSLLLSAAEDRLRAAHCRSVELETAVDNLSALSFYKRHGYSVIKTRPRYYSNGVDALVMEKPLQSPAKPD